MADNSRIDYISASINPLGWGCYGPNGTRERPNRCPWCYAYRMAKRNLRECKLCCEFVPHWHEKELDKPARWHKRRRIFVQSMGDLFYEGAPWYVWQRVWELARDTMQHTYIVLTKNPHLMTRRVREIDTMPFSNLWLGTSITNQTDADERIPYLLETPAAIRWLSLEPLVGRVSLAPYLPNPPGKIMLTYGGSEYLNRVDWVVMGALTGPGSSKRAPKREWIEQIREQCRAARVPLFEKQSLARYVDGPLIQQFPEEAM